MLIRKTGVMQPPFSTICSSSINFAAAIRQHAMPIVIKRDEPIDELPHLLVGRMEDMRTIKMNLNALFCPATAIPAYGLAFLQDQHVPAGLRQPTGNRAAPQPRTRNYRVFHKNFIGAPTRIPHTENPLVYRYQCCGFAASHTRKTCSYNTLLP